MILLDTQVVVWVTGNDERLGRHARMAIMTEPDRRVSTMVA